MPENIYVTKPYLPDFDAYTERLRTVWDRRILTNNGPEHDALETALRDRFGVTNLSLVANGTIALILALQALGLEDEGEVITTPFSFVATAHALRWLGLEPRFVDIDPQTLNLDPACIEAAITDRTRAIVAVHVYGHPCDVDAIDDIAARHGLKVIYDAAHAFGVECHCGSVLTHGDASTLSFHATKVFNTFEGGAVLCRDPAAQDKVNKLKNFGFVDETTVIGVGINGKMAEPNAILGLLQLDELDKIIEARKSVADRYKQVFADIDGIQVVPNAGELRENYAYFPIRVGPDFPLSRDALYDALKGADVYCRRYFYPLITDFPAYADPAHDKTLPNARQAANEVICLPIYPDLSPNDQDRVIAVIRTAAESRPLSAAGGAE